MDFENILFEVKDRVATITINRPPLNIIDLSTLREMIQALEEVRDRKDIKVLLLTGAGDRAFSTGVSVQDHLPDKVNEMVPLFSQMYRTLLSLEQPTIAVVNGHCLGGGCEVACLCDLVIASEKSQFGQPEIKLGDYGPLAVAAYPRLIGMRRAFEFLLTGDTVDAREAQRMGLVNAVVPEAELAQAVDKLVNKLTAHSRVALGASKRAIYAGHDLPLEQSLNIAEDIFLNTLAKSKDYEEGLRAFLEKRAPVWRDE